MKTELEKITNELNQIAARFLELGLPWRAGMLTDVGNRIHTIEFFEGDEMAYFTFGHPSQGDFGECLLEELGVPDLWDDVTFAWVESWLRQKGLEEMMVTRQPTRLEEAQQILRALQATLDTVEPV